MKGVERSGALRLRICSRAGRSEALAEDCCDTQDAPVAGAARASVLVLFKVHWTGDGWHMCTVDVHRSELSSHAPRKEDDVKELAETWTKVMTLREWHSASVGTSKGINAQLVESRVPFQPAQTQSCQDLRVSLSTMRAALRNWAKYVPPYLLKSLWLVLTIDLLRPWFVNLIGCIERASAFDSHDATILSKGSRKGSTSDHRQHKGPNHKNAIRRLNLLQFYNILQCFSQLNAQCTDVSPGWKRSSCQMCQTHWASPCIKHWASLCMGRWTAIA